MVSNRVEAAGFPLGGAQRASDANSRKAANSFSAQLNSALQVNANPAKGHGATSGEQSGARGRDSASRQLLVVKPSVTASASASAASSSAASGLAYASGKAPAGSGSQSPTMLGMGPLPGSAAVTSSSSPAAVASVVPQTEADAYWAAQPAAVQVLRNMPDGEDKDHLALQLANQGYAIDTQIMVWGWDPQMTMTVRENQGYAWVPSYGQANIAVAPGVSDPYEPSNYDPSNPPAGSIKVSTAFAVGTIQNPLVTA